VTAAEHADQIQRELNEHWLPRVYRERILKLRTRSYHFGRLRPRVEVDILHTLLGVELRVGRRRLFCPDLATARYLSVFARVGCSDVAVPYDITKVSQLADQLESSWYRMVLLVDHLVAGGTERMKTRVRGLLIAKVRKEIAEAGPGARIPHFKQSTRQS
jgi:hypothetical protein